MPAYIASEAALAAAKARLRKKCMGSMGAGARSSQATKAASAPTPVRLVSNLIMVDVIASNCRAERASNSAGGTSPRAPVLRW